MVRYLVTAMTVASMGCANTPDVNQEFTLCDFDRDGAVTLQDLSAQIQLYGLVSDSYSVVGDLMIKAEDVAFCDKAYDKEQEI